MLIKMEVDHSPIHAITIEKINDRIYNLITREKSRMTPLLWFNYK